VQILKTALLLSNCMLDLSWLLSRCHQQPHRKAVSVSCKTHFLSCVALVQCHQNVIQFKPWRPDHLTIYACCMSVLHPVLNTVYKRYKRSQQFKRHIESLLLSAAELRGIIWRQASHIQSPELNAADNHVSTSHLLGDVSLHLLLLPPHLAS
jgi:hypothetical protein